MLSGKFNLSVCLSTVVQARQALYDLLRMVHSTKNVYITSIFKVLIKVHIFYFKHFWYDIHCMKRK